MLLKLTFWITTQQALVGGGTRTHVSLEISVVYSSCIVLSQYGSWDFLVYELGTGYEEYIWRFSFLISFRIPLWDIVVIRWEKAWTWYWFFKVGVKEGVTVVDKGGNINERITSYTIDDDEGGSSDGYVLIRLGSGWEPKEIIEVWGDNWRYMELKRRMVLSKLTWWEMILFFVARLRQWYPRWCVT